MPYEYFSDEEHLKLWLEKEKDPVEFKKFLDRYILGTKNFEEYLDLCGGLQRINELRAQEKLIHLNNKG